MAEVPSSTDVRDGWRMVDYRPQPLTPLERLPPPKSPFAAAGDEAFNDVYYELPRATRALSLPEGSAVPG
jgi:hypothetical protein